VVPLGVQPEILSEPAPFPLRTRKRFKFLFVGGTIARKGIDLLLEAYTRAFSRNDDVCLVIKDFGTNSFYRSQTYGTIIGELQRDTRAPEIEYIPDELTPDQLRDLYHSCDCLAHPYRGEGFGLPIAEAMACGLPVIVPDQGGASDFCTAETALLVASQRKIAPVRVDDALAAVATPWWIEVKLPELRARMRAAYENPETTTAIARRGQELIRSRFTWNRAAEVAEAEIHELGTAGEVPLRLDARSQYTLRMQEGIACWERQEPHTALRHFVQARGFQDDPDTLFNIASVLIVNGDTRNAASILATLAARLESADDSDGGALLTDVRAALESCRIRNGEPAPPTPVSVRWRAPVFNASGYASETRSFLEPLLASPDWKIHLEPHDAVNDWGMMERPLFEALQQRVGQSGGKPWIDFQHGPASTFTKPAAPLSVARCMFESDRLPNGWAEACNQFAEVWVPSVFNRETFARSGVLEEKIRIVPGAIDAAAYSPERYPVGKQRGTRRFQFLSVFDFTPRKGWDVLLRAYLEEFSADEEVTLMVKVVNFFGESRPEERLREFIRQHSFRNLPNLVLIDRVCSEDDLRQLYAGCDAFVLASRGEGWGRPYMEAMAFGKPTIGTRWSANLEFMSDQNSFLVEISGLEPCEMTWSSMPLYRGHLWASPSVGSLRQQMRRVFEDRDEARQRGVQARADVVASYDLPVVARRVQAEFVRLLNAG
jgi:glycosyltransferase involved in cell wall biosynthesis